MHLTCCVYIRPAPIMLENLPIIHSGISQKPLPIILYTTTYYSQIILLNTAVPITDTIDSIIYYTCP